MQHLTFKNMVVAFLALNFISAFVIHSQFRNAQVVSLTYDPSRSPKPLSITPDTGAKQPAVVKVLDLPDSETLRFNETTFVDLGWRQTAEKGGEWVGHIGSDTEYVPLNADQIAGMLKEAQLKSLPQPPVAHAPGDRKRHHAAVKGVEPVGHIRLDDEDLQLSAGHISGLLDDLQPLALPPVPRAAAPLPETPRPESSRPEAPAVEPKTAPSTPKGIDLLDYIPVMLGIFFMMYIRYRITQVTLDAAQSATGMVQRALSDLFAPSRATAPLKPAAIQGVAVRSEPPAAVRAAGQKSKTNKTRTVVRPAPGLFGFLIGAR